MDLLDLLIIVIVIMMITAAFVGISYQKNVFYIKDYCKNNTPNDCYKECLNYFADDYCFQLYNKYKILEELQ